ncbi:MAG: hypothetical protein ACKV0T_27155, partial [Planctomycetales bacterium]
RHVGFFCAPEFCPPRGIPAFRQRMASEGNFTARRQLADGHGIPVLVRDLSNAGLNQMPHVNTGETACKT